MIDRRTPSGSIEGVETERLLWRTVLATTPACIKLIGADGKLIELNQAGLDMLELSDLESARARSWSDFIPAEHRDRYAKLIESALSGVEGSLEFEIVGDKGTRRAVSSHASPVRSADGRVWAALKITHDLSAVRRAELELHESETRFREMVQRLPIGLLVQGSNTEIRLSNGAALEMLGLSEDQLLGMTSLDPDWRVIHEDGSEFPGPTHPVPVAIATGRPVSDVVMGVYRPRHADWIWLLVNAVPLLDRDGRVREVICTFSDITQKKLTEQQLLQAQKMESIGRLAAGIAHDFNNLLTVINGTVELALQDGSVASTLREDLERIGGAGNRAAELTQQLLAFSRKQMLRPKRIDPNGLIRDTVRLIQRILGEDIEIQLQLAPELPDVEVDPGQLHQVLLNLAVNSRDAMPRGGILTFQSIEVEIGARRDGKVPALPAGRYVRLSLEDTGIGMDTKTQQRVFEPFFTTKEQGKGTGLGLATVHGIVKQSGGEVTIESSVGLGTTVHIYFPVATGAPEPAQRIGPSQRHRGKTVLVVDDDSAVRMIATRLLERAGYVTIEAASALEALQLLDEYKDPVELMIVDVVMPNMGGRELAEWVRDHRPEMRILFASGYSDDAIVQHGVAQEKVALLKKPYGAEDLYRKVSELLDAPPR